MLRKIVTSYYFTDLVKTELVIARGADSYKTKLLRCLKNEQFSESIYDV